MNDMDAKMYHVKSRDLLKNYLWGSGRILSFLSLKLKMWSSMCYAAFPYTLEFLFSRLIPKPILLSTRKFIVKEIGHKLSLQAL